MIDITWNRVDGRTVEFYRDRRHVIVLGLFEQGALFNWAILWNGRSAAGRWPRRRLAHHTETDSNGH